jgi:type I restriction enzyme S subunit
MRDGWTETILGNVAILNPKEGALSPDAPFIPMDAVHVGKRFVQYVEPRGDRNGARAATGDVLFARITPCLENGKVAQVQDGIEKCGGSTEFIVIRGTQVFNSDFAYFWATWDATRNRAAGLMTGTTGRQRLSASDLGAMSVHLPPLAEQKRIVDVVSSVDAYIDALQQQVDTARTARNAVLHELLSAGGEDWTETTLGLLVSLRTGKLDVNAGVEDGEFPFFTCSRDTYKIDVAAYSGKSVIVAGNGDLNVKYYEGEFNAYQRTYILQAIDESVLNPTFLFHFMDKYLETLRNDTQGSTIQYLKKAQFTEAPIALPSLVEQKRIVEIVTSMDDVIQSTEQAVTDAKKLRSGLLSDLLSGEHEIPASYDVFVGAA